MRKKGGAMLCLAIMISAIAVMALFVVLIFAFKEAFTYNGELIKNVMLLLTFVIIISAVVMLVLLQKERKSHLDALLQDGANQSICPNCHINLSKDCLCCPNCKTKIGE